MPEFPPPKLPPVLRPPKLLPALCPPKLPPELRLPKLPPKEREGWLVERVDGEKERAGWESPLEKRLPKVRLELSDGMFTVERVLLWRGIPKDLVPLVEGLAETEPEPKVRLRSGLSLTPPRCKLPKVRLPTCWVLPRCGMLPGADVQVLLPGS